MTGHVMTWQVHPENCARCALRQQRHAAGMHALDVILHPACEGGSAVSTLRAWAAAAAGGGWPVRAARTSARRGGHTTHRKRFLSVMTTSSLPIFSIQMPLVPAYLTCGFHFGSLFIPAPCDRAHAATRRRVLAAPKHSGTWLLNASVWAGWCSALGSFLCSEEMSLLRRLRPAGLPAIFY